MATSLTSSLNLNIGGSYTNDATNLPPTNQTVGKQITRSLANGTSDNQANVRYEADSYSIGATTNLDLNLLSIVDALGTTLTFVEVRQIVIENLSTTAADLITIGGGDDGAGNNACFTNMFGTAATLYRLQPTGIFLFNANNDTEGLTVGAGANILRLANATAGSISVYINIIGVDA